MQGDTCCQAQVVQDISQPSIPHLVDRKTRKRHLKRMWGGICGEVYVEVYGIWGGICGICGEVYVGSVGRNVGREIFIRYLVAVYNYR